MENKNRIEIIKENIKMQLIYDKIKNEHTVEMEKVVNSFTDRKESLTNNFIPFEQIILYEDFLNIAGQEVVADLLRFFSNLDFCSYDEFVDSLSIEELDWIETFMKQFRYFNAKNIDTFSLSELLKSAIKAYRNNEEWNFNIESLSLERVKSCEN